jgi:hypothetical protein
MAYMQGAKQPRYAAALNCEVNDTGLLNVPPDVSDGFSITNSAALAVEFWTNTICVPSSEILGEVVTVPPVLYAKATVTGGALTLPPHPPVPVAPVYRLSYPMMLAFGLGLEPCVIVGVPVLVIVPLNVRTAPVFPVIVTVEPDRDTIAFKSAVPS